jgi:hypothetical protein
MTQTWDALDLRLHHCSEKVMGKPKHYTPIDNMGTSWDTNDLEAGRCVAEEVGTPRHPPAYRLVPPPNYIDDRIAPTPAPSENPVQSAEPSDLTQLIEEHGKSTATVRKVLVKHFLDSPQDFLDSMRDRYPAQYLAAITKILPNEGIAPPSSPTIVINLGGSLGKLVEANRAELIIEPNVTE